jgi:syntaxin 16
MNSPTMPGTPLPGPNPLVDPSMLESEADRSFSQATLQQTSQKRLYHDNDAVISQREREIENIAQGVIDIANIFQELQTMVIDQGSMLDRIDFNVESMATDMRAADKELTVATGYQRKSLKRKIMLLLFLIIVGMFILLGFKVGGKNSPAPAPQPPPSPPNVDPIPGKRSFLGERNADPGVARHALLRREWRRRRRRSQIEPLLYVRR